MSHTQRILTVVTNTDEYRKVGFRTGLWLSELTHFCDVAEQAGYAVDIASPLGGKVPLDPESLMLTQMGQAFGIDSAVSKRYRDRAFMDRLGDSLALPALDAADYDAIYLTGGHGVMFDFPDCAALAQLIAQFHQSGKPVAAVCHGPAGLLKVRLDDGSGLLSNRRVTGYSWQEEQLAKRDDAVPFSLQDALTAAGGMLDKATLPFVAHVVEDGLLITGQNPASARGVAKAVVRRLQAAAQITAQAAS